MTPDKIALIIGCGLALAYGAFYCWSDVTSPIRTLVKAGGVVCLSLAVLSAGGPLLLAGALAVSAIGDAFLAGDDEKWLLPGMGAFFAAHVAYIVLFMQFGGAVPADAALLVGIQFGIVLPLLCFLYWVSKSAGELQWPVRAYGVVILIMGILATSLWPEYPLVAIGAGAFILSDMLLSIELFKKPDGAPKSLPQSLAIWATYFGGQLMIALGILQMV